MPELPEVEVSRLGVQPYLLKQNIQHIVVRDDRLRWPVPDAIKSIVNQPILSITRRAKYILIELDGGHIVLHLGMSGTLRVVEVTTPPKKHDHIDIVLGSGKCLRLNDPRRFGSCLWQVKGEMLSQLANLGPEPLTDDFDANRLFEYSRNKQTPIKAFIMDNRVVVGVGNIYANESLFLAGIDPRRAAGKVSKKRYQTLTSYIKQVLDKAIQQGGTTLKDFTNADGNPGYFSQHLRVYGRAGESCECCDSLIKSKVIGQRNTFFCTQCQR